MDITATDDEVTLMAAVLRRRFADTADQIASRFASEHRLIGDAERADQWDRVSAEIRQKRTLS